MGDGRLRNGLAYYPAVSVSGSTIAVGNVVALRLTTEAGKEYLGYGHLKGIWLWRDQPRIRVQYFAPVLPDPPADAIAANGRPEAGALPELLVTSKVGDLSLDVLKGCVFVKAGPLVGQLFQRNVASTCAKVQCVRSVDSSMKNAQPLAADFELTPTAQPFSRQVIEAVCGLPPSTEPEPKRPPKAAAAASTASAAKAAPRSSGGGGGGGGSMLPGPPSRVLLQTTVDGSLLQGGEILRYPGSLNALRARVARMYGLWAPSVKLSYQRTSGKFQTVLLKTSADVTELVEAQAAADVAGALPLKVSGAATVSLASFACALLSLGSCGASVGFAYACVWGADPALGAPWVFAALLPLWLAAYNGVASFRCVVGEYRLSVPLRQHVDAAETGAALLVVAALLGPDLLLLAAELRLPPLGASLGRRAAQALRRCALVQHVVHGVPLLVLNVALHTAGGVAWDGAAQLVLLANLLSLLFVLPWQILELSHARNLGVPLAAADGGLDV